MQSQKIEKRKTRVRKRVEEIQIEAGYQGIITDSKYMNRQTRKLKIQIGKQANISMELELNPCLFRK